MRRPESIARSWVGPCWAPAFRFMRNPRTPPSSGRALPEADGARQPSRAGPELRKPVGTRDKSAAALRASGARKAGDAVRNSTRNGRSSSRKTPRRLSEPLSRSRLREKKDAWARCLISDLPVAPVNNYSSCPGYGPRAIHAFLAAIAVKTVEVPAQGPGPINGEKSRRFQRPLDSKLMPIPSTMRCPESWRLGGAPPVACLPRLERGASRRPLHLRARPSMRRVPAT